jgi:hypothetical protein
MRPVAASLLVMGLALGCASAGGDEEAAGADERFQPGRERLLVKTAELSVAVDEVAKGVAAAEARATSLGGYVSASRVSGKAWAQLELRVPSSRLDEALTSLSALGEERSRSVAASDVTTEVGDLEAQLTNQRALRDRLRALLARAEKVEDVLAVERELTRLQTEIDAGETRLTRLRSDLAMSALSLHLVERRPPRILGPLGYLWVGTKWFVTKLFVIRE